MTNTLIGYARCSPDKQDLTAQQDALLKLGVTPDRIYTDRGFRGPTVRGPASIRRWRPYAAATRW